MLSDVLDQKDIREMTSVIAGSSLIELERMKANIQAVLQLLSNEVQSRGVPVVKAAPVEVRVVQSAGRRGKVKRVCDNKGCGVVYEARQADLKRGWGMCCSKSCAASHKLRGNPNHGYLRGTARDERYMSPDEIRERDHQAALDECGQGWDGHKDSF